MKHSDLSRYSADLESDGSFEAPGTIYDRDGKRTVGLSSIWQHREDAPRVLERLRTHPARGLRLSDATQRLAKAGPNVLSPPLQKPWWRKLLSHFTDFFSLMLQFAALLCFAAFVTEPTEPMHLYLGIFLYAVVIATSLFSYVQQHKSDSTLREFQNLLPPKAVVRRDGGRTFEIAASELVVGDIVLVRTGDKIPADLRVLNCNRFSVDNSSLTGESEPIELTAEVSGESPLESANLAFFGCLAVDGTCTGVVIATGDRTVFGEIARLTSAADGEMGKTTLQKDIHHFVMSISMFAIAVGLLFFVVGLVKGTHFIHNLAYSIGIIVSNIPEGLLATVTVSLTASARRMSRKHVLVKKLDAVETLGSTTVICSDKTGTLTKNVMNVSHIVCGGRVEKIDENWDPSQLVEDIASEDGGQMECVQSLIYGASVCSTAVFDSSDVNQNPNKSIDERIVCGDASEAGILRFTERIHNVEKFRAENAMVASIPFNSRNKYMVTTHRSAESEHVLRVVVKGAPERILERSTEILSKEGVRDLGERDKALLERQMNYLAARGERVLGFAEKQLSPQRSALILNGDGSNPSIDDIPTSELCFVGFISLIDPPRDSAAQAVQTCKDAGIRVIMVTGDHHETARSIAQQVGIITKAVIGEDETALERLSSSAVVVKGSEIQQATEQDWNEILSHDEIVFARTSPDQKLKIVEQLQRVGEIVTVTGDGCNDAPALRQANSGIAMGISGSDVSREAADIVLLDDNFSSIVNGVEEGRLIFDNLKKSIAYTLTSNVPQLVPFLFFITLQIPLPLTTVLILCIDLGTDIFPAIALAYEHAESDIMKRPPRNAQTDRLMNPRLVSYATLQLGIFQTFAGFFAYLVILADYGLGPSTLPGLSSGAHFASERPSHQRWLYTIQPHPNRVAYKADWFSNQHNPFTKYFETTQNGFIQQKEQRFDKLLRNAQFDNMVKIIAFETRQPPCLSFTCNVSQPVKSSVTNDAACFDPRFNSGPVSLIGLHKHETNDKVIQGKGPRQGCFSLWTPRQQQQVLRRAQTGFFVAVVVTQIFTLLTCKTRIIGLFRSGIHNSALMLSLALELMVSFVLVYSPLLRIGFDIRPLRVVHWLPALPFGLFMLFYDEVRKALIRRHLENESGLIVPRLGMVDGIAKWVHDYTLW